ncbi:MAG: GNAT family N-acetyltransferase [Actinomycetota bacterium]
MQIRAVRSDELAALQGIERAAGETFRAIGMSEIADDDPLPLDELVRFQEQGMAWAAVDRADKPVAYLIARPVDDTLYVEQVSVDPAHARSGFGRQLLDHASNWAASRALPALTLSTFALVPWNAPYYQRLGFRLINEYALSPGLQEIRTQEESLGLNRWPRVFMRRSVLKT